MRRPWLAATLALGLGLFPNLGRAQDAAGTVEDAPKTQQIRAVERGAFLETGAGLTFIVNKMDNRRYGLSPVVSLFFGFDVLPILNISLGATAIAAGLSESVDTPQPRSDIFFVIPGIRAQFAVLTTERNFLWVRGEAGFSLGLPAKIGDLEYGGNGPAFAGMLGFERFTKLRHFSLGAQAGVHVVTKPAVGIGVSVLPTFKYTF